MTRPTPFEPARAVRLIACLLVIAALYFGREILIPAALAVLLTFLLHPLVRRAHAIGINRAVAVAGCVLLTTLITAFVAFMVGRQVLDLSLRLPDYRDNLRTKIHALRQTGESKVARLSGTIKELKQELSAASQPSMQPAIPVPENPVKVQLVDTGIDATDIAASVLQPLFGPLAQAGITLLLLSFLLLHSDDIRGRLISLAGMRRVSLTSSAMNEIGERIGRYLRMQLVVNMSYGMMVAVALYCLGLPNAFLWGALGFALRFVPYIGPWLAAILPTLLAVAVYPAWTRAIGVVGAFVVIEFITNLVLEPWLYSASTGISSLGVVVASVFWAFVWGPVGLILAVPLTVSLIVIGKHAPPLEMLNRLFGSDSTVPEPERLYQYLLAEDAGLADELLKASLKEHSLAQVCDDVLVPALCALKRDVVASRVPVNHARRALATLDLVLASDDVAAPGRPACPPILCIAAQNIVDTSAARLLARVLRQRGLNAEAISAEMLASEAAQQVVKDNAAFVTVVQLAPYSPPHSQRHFRSLRAHAGDDVQITDVALCAESSGNPEADAPADRRDSRFTHIVNRLVERCSIPREPKAQSGAPALA